MAIFKLFIGGYGSAYIFPAILCDRGGARRNDTLTPIFRSEYLEGLRPPYRAEAYTEFFPCNNNNVFTSRFPKIVSLAL